MKKYLALLLLLLTGCNALCFASADPNIWGQQGDDMTYLAWYGYPACYMGDFLP